MRVFYGDEKPVLEPFYENDTDPKPKPVHQTETTNSKSINSPIDELLRELGFSVDWVWVLGPSLHGRERRQYRTLRIKSPDDRSVLYVFNHVQGTFRGEPAEIYPDQDWDSPKSLRHTDILVSCTQNEIFFVSEEEWEQL